jgi:DNA-binding transcriptional LysR family regulator
LVGQAALGATGNDDAKLCHRDFGHGRNGRLDFGDPMSIGPTSRTVDQSEAGINIRDRHNIVVICGLIEVSAVDRLGAMRMFIEIVDQGSLSAASRRLQVSLPVVVRALAGLEKRLGVRLLNRTTRRIHLTEEGAEFYQRCKRIVVEVEAAEQTAFNQRQTPSGNLVVNAPVLFGRIYVAPLIGTFLEMHPLLKVELTLTDRNVDIVEEGVDVAVRIGHLPDSSFGAVKLGLTQRVLVASPAYLERAGTPKNLEELRKHNCLRFYGLPPSGTWQFVRGGREVGISVSGSFASSSGDAVIETALHGRGIACVLYYQVMNYAAAGALRLVLQEFAPRPVPIHAVFAHPRLVSAKVRAFVDHLKRGFGGLSFVPVEEKNRRAASARSRRPRTVSSV